MWCPDLVLRQIFAKYTLLVKFSIFLWKAELNKPTAHTKKLVTFGSISAKNADAGTMCQLCRAMWSLHQEILNETLSLGDITSNEI
jgi:hypothetical protein